MATYVYWFLAGLVLLGLEMITGTFYLLMLGIALGIGGCAALLGLAPPGQFALAAIAAVVGTAILHKTKGARPAAANDQNLDIGQAVQIIAWRDNGTVRAHYRGADWDAELEATDTPQDGALYIKALRGSTLILTHIKP